VPPPLLLKIPARNFIRKKAIDEAAAKKILAAAGVKTPLGEVANEKTAAAAARRVGFPAAVKALGVVHKTDSGAVVLNCRDAADVKRAVLSIRKKNPRTRSFLVEEMISREGAVELIVGARTDSQFGLLIVVGFGGELAEIYRDTAALLPPPSKAEIKAALLSLRGAALLRGFRNRKKTLAAAVNEAFRIASFAAKARPAELDINPLIVRPDGAAFAADALLITGDD
jgi:acetyl-CoA synthetase